MGLVFLKEELVPKRRVSEIKKSWEEEGPRKKVKIPVAGKILEVEEDPGDQSCMEMTARGCPEALTGNAQDW